MNMTLTELERCTDRALEGALVDAKNHDVESTVLALIADWRAMRRYVENWAHGNDARADELIANLRLKP